MTFDANINVHHVTRVEGHGDLTARIENGKVKEIRFAVVEAPRLFEVFLRNRTYDEVIHLASRICGICAVSHKCAALKATENAFKVTPSEQTLLLRRLAFHGEIISSHILHIYFLAAPDFLGVPSVFPLVETDREIVLRAMRMKKLAYDLCAVVAGRHTHPVAMTVGGFSFVHSRKALEAIKSRIDSGIDDLKATVALFKTLDIPRFERETLFVSLKHPDEYALYDGEIFCSNGTRSPVNQYLDIIGEYVLPYSTAKYARFNQSQYMVGALARVNNNYDQLSFLAKNVADDLGLTLPCYNPFMNTVAQIVECAHCLEQSLEILTVLLEKGITADNPPEFCCRKSHGIGAVEAPRGILFHDYQYDDNGKCVNANLVIPTAQNLSNLESDLSAYANLITEENEESIRHKLEMLVRAYDPCISCSTHTLNVRAKKEGGEEVEKIFKKMEK